MWSVQEYGQARVEPRAAPACPGGCSRQSGIGGALEKGRSLTGPVSRVCSAMVISRCGGGGQERGGRHDGDSLENGERKQVPPVAGDDVRGPGFNRAFENRVIIRVGGYSLELAGYGDNPQKREQVGDRFDCQLRRE